ncbi:uncharacterized protein LOC110686807 [Chenopodium quinoa]|uniref:uncharacterized protein LOC110686807 n=1 Tax=Chenopodium quinoa TaxID=63459 RepID=UPI000B77D1CB|nr:uncharacterized protein LOC110686807 [Chenopodium quinoa]
MRHKLDKQFGRFIDMLKQLNLSLPFIDVINQMLNYAKSLKDILSGKRTCDVVETINLTENCSAIIMNKIPPKLKDPGNFSIPYAINKMQFDNPLCDLGASVSLMPYSVYQRLDLGELLPSNISLQLAYRSIKFPKEMDEDATIPIILGRTFFATSGAMVDVKCAKISLKVGDELGVSCKEVALYEELLNGRMEEVDEQLCLKISIHEALQEAATKEGGVSYEECIVYLEKCLARCVKVNLVLNWEKCHFMVEEGIVLGHKISHKEIEVDKAKIEIIEKLRPLKIHQGFLTHCQALNDLLQKDVEFIFDDKCLEAFNRLKKALISTPIVQAPRWDLPFELMCDVSDWEIGGVLGQRVEKKLYVTYYMSKTLNGAQKNYTTTKKEFLTIVHSFEIFQCYLFGSKTIVFTDQAALNYLFAKKESKPRLIRWVLELQTFEIEIRDKKGAENVVADHLYRLEGDQIHDNGLPIEDIMFDDVLYAIKVKDLPWYADLVNFLACGEFPPSFSKNQKKKLKREARHYLWDEPILYKRWVDGLLRRCVPNK